MDILIITRFCIELPYVYRKKMDYSNIKKILFQLSLLEKFTLPSILFQTNNEFKWIILIDKRLPFVVKKKIEYLSEKYNQLYFKYHNNDDISNLSYYNEFLNNKNKYIITVRLDADDALIYNYIDILKKFAIRSLYKLDIGAICFNRGLTLTVESSNKFHLRPTTMSSHGLGIALFAKKSIFNKNIYFTAHNEINENLKKLGKINIFEIGRAHV